MKTEASSCYPSDPHGVHAKVILPSSASSQWLELSCYCLKQDSFNEKSELKDFPWDSSKLYQRCTTVWDCPYKILSYFTSPKPASSATNSCFFLLSSFTGISPKKTQSYIILCWHLLLKGLEQTQWQYTAVINLQIKYYCYKYTAHPALPQPLLTFLRPQS